MRLFVCLSFFDRHYLGSSLPPSCSKRANALPRIERIAKICHEMRSVLHFIRSSDCAQIIQSSGCVCSQMCIDWF